MEESKLASSFSQSFRIADDCKKFEHMPLDSNKKLLARSVKRHKDDAELIYS